MTMELKGGHIIFYKMFGAFSSIQIDEFDSRKFPARLYQSMKLFANGSQWDGRDSARSVDDWFKYWTKI